jgi:hypothetical protein
MRVCSLALGPLPGAEDEVVAFDEVDADPRVVLEALGKDADGLTEHVVGLGLAVHDPIDSLEGASIRICRDSAHRATATSTSAPSKPTIASR